MDDTISIYAAKTHLSRLIVRVEAGEVITIARGKTPVARLVPVARKPNGSLGRSRKDHHRPRIVPAPAGGRAQTMGPRASATASRYAVLIGRLAGDPAVERRHRSPFPILPTKFW